MLPALFCQCHNTGRLSGGRGPVSKGLMALWPGGAASLVRADREGAAGAVALAVGDTDIGWTESDGAGTTVTVHFPAGRCFW